VPVGRRDLYTGYDLDIIVWRQFQCDQRSGNLIVIGNGHHIQAALGGCPEDGRNRSGAVPTIGRMKM